MPDDLTAAATDGTPPSATNPGAMNPGPTNPTIPIPVVRRRRRRRRWPVVAMLTVVGLAAGAGTGILVDAHKVVMLDVDGEVTRVTTFAGSVGGLLERHGIEVGEHDVVTPAVDARLRDNADVVVRYGRELTFEADGAQETGWVAALDADDALRRLGGRGGDVRLVASRSGGRATLPLPLSAGGGTVDIVVDGETRTLTYDDTGMDRLLERAGVEVAEEDLVSVVPARGNARGAAVVVVIQRVVTAEETTVTPLPFERTERRDAQRFTDQSPRVEQAGVEGSRTIVERVTTIDGVETERVLVSEDEVPPVNEVVAVGTRRRPPPAPPAGGGSGDGAVGDDVWVRLAQCESGGRPDAVSPGGRFHGLYQFSVATWRSVGGEGLPSQASPQEQRMRAQMLQARSGWGQWPACSRRLGLR